MNPTSFKILKDTPLFSQLDDDDLAVVETRLLELTFSDGDVIFKEGMPGRYVCFLVEGSVEVQKQTDDGVVAIAELGPGQSVGEMSIIDGLTCSATVVARAPTTLMAFTREQFEIILDEYPRVGAAIYKGLSRLLSMSLRQTTADLAALKAAASEGA